MCKQMGEIVMQKLPLQCCSDAVQYCYTWFYRERKYSEMHAEINTYTGSDQGLWNGKRVMQRDIGGIGSLHT